MREALKAHGIPVRQRRQQELPKDWSTARAFIALLTNPENDSLAMKFLTLVKPEQAMKMKHQAEDEYTSINDRWLHIRQMQLQDVTTSMLGWNASRESIGRVRELIEQLQPQATVLELQVALHEQDEEAAEEGPGVTVGTAHSSKGREWEAVHVVGVEEGIWPSRREIAEDQGEESRRLLYVAITRAKRICVISHALKREIQWKGVQEMAPSRFIKEIMT